MVRSIARGSVVKMFGVIALSAVALGASGCTDIRTARIDPAVCPDDFSVDVTILTGSGAKDLPQAHTRQGKLTLLADGSLHSDAGDTLNFATRPAPTRWLYQRQVDGLWTLAGELGWLDPSTANIDLWPGAVRPTADEIVYIIFFHGDGTDWWYVRRFKSSEIPDPKAVQFVRSLCDLAWSTDRGPDRSLPHRYDFGPNPYEGFAKAPPFSFEKPTQ
ncbi:MAG: hypothetical protein EXS17_06915 [Phycisphaerales bacterium]|nr:hypothetical protein [Phycisphaerales bacterium]